jgi:hypothetical protein
MYTQEIDRTRLGELLPLLFDVAQSLLIQLGTEVGITANALIRRLGMEKQDVEVVLAGSVFKGKGHLLPETATHLVHTIAPRARVMRPPYKPVVGAAFIALEAIGVTISSDQQAQLMRTLPGELLLA